MLVSLSISNFRSFHKEETFSLVASKRQFSKSPDLNHFLPIPNSEEYVLRVAVIYGPNGAGKSNILKALQYIKTIALKANVKGSSTRRDPFKFIEPYISTPSNFDLQFIVKDKLYRYGFSLNDTAILEEWLFEVKHDVDYVLFERTTDESGRVTIQYGKDKFNTGKYEALRVIGGPHNQSFLATINATLDSSDYGDEISGILHWFKSTLSLTGPNDTYPLLGPDLVSDPSFSKFAGDFLEDSSTGINRLITEKIEISYDELCAQLPKSLVPLVDDIKAGNFDGEYNRGGIIHETSSGTHYLIEKTETIKYYKLIIHANHKIQSKAEFTLNLNEESDGTRRLLDFIPELFKATKNDYVKFIDEIDRSLHPLLVEKLMNYFLSSCANTANQLIVTTHETHLLDTKILRRDEFWFAEKDLNLSSHIYSLSDYEVRKDLAIRKNYLDGRFGAIPLLNNIEHIHIKN